MGRQGSARRHRGWLGGGWAPRARAGAPITRPKAFVVAGLVGRRVRAGSVTLCARFVARRRWLALYRRHPTISRQSASIRFRGTARSGRWTHFDTRRDALRPTSVGGSRNTRRSQSKRHVPATTPRTPALQARDHKPMRRVNDAPIPPPSRRAPPRDSAASVDSRGRFRPRSFLAWQCDRLQRRCLVLDRALLV